MQLKEQDVVTYLVLFQDDAQESNQFDIREEYPTLPQAMNRFQELINSFFISPNKRNELPFIELYKVEYECQIQMATFMFDWDNEEGEEEDIDE